MSPDTNFCYIHTTDWAWSDERSNFFTDRDNQNTREEIDAAYMKASQAFADRMKR